MCDKTTKKFTEYIRNFIVAEREKRGCNNMRHNKICSFNVVFSQNCIIEFETGRGILLPLHNMFNYS